MIRDGVSIPFQVNPSDPARINVHPTYLAPVFTATGVAYPTIVVSVLDQDGGIAEQSADLIVGSDNSDDLLTVTDFSFRAGQKRLIVLGLGGNDVLDASGITNPEFSVILFGGAGNDLLFDGAGQDVVILGDGDDSLNLPATDPRNLLGIEPNMGGDDEIFFVPNSTLTAYDNLGRNTLNFSLANSNITQNYGITFDLDLTVDRGTGITAQDVAPASPESDTHFVAALGTFHKLIGSHFGDHLTAASDSEIFGGLGADRFFTKDDITDVVFGGGDDADVLTALGQRVSRIRFDGDAGPDELQIDAQAEVLDLLEFSGGDDADLLINRGRVSRVIFSGGSDADLLQNLSGRISRVRFDGDDGPDQLINEELATIEWQTGDDPTLEANAGIEFNGGDDADLLINRGRVSRVIFSGGSDADLLQNLSGRISRVRFDGDDGPDQLINEQLATIEWQTGDDPTLEANAGIEFNGGDDADLLINRGRVSRVIFSGGSDADVLQNLSGRISRVRFDGDDGPDQLINEALATIEWQTGDDPALEANAGIEFSGVTMPTCSSTVVVCLVSSSPADRMPTFCRI